MEEKGKNNLNPGYHFLGRTACSMSCFAFNATNYGICLGASLHACAQDVLHSLLISNIY